MRPDVSVLLPFRDALATLPEAVESVLAQEGPRLELLAVDDGSTDDGAAWLARRASGDARVRRLRTGGLGLVPALNLAAAEARAPFLARMDADDVCLPGRLARQLARLEAEPGLGAIGTRVEAFPAEAVGEGLLRYVAWQNNLVSPTDHVRDLFVESPLCHPSVVLRREAFGAVGGYRDVSWWEDYDLWLRLVDAGWHLAKVPEVLLRWRHLEGRMTFHHPRGTPEQLRRIKACFLAPRLERLGRPLTVWGAGPTGKRLARALESHGLRASRFVDIDPHKIGRRARSAPIVAPDDLERGAETVVVAVGSRGARSLIRQHLDPAGFVEGVDYLCAA